VLLEEELFAAGLVKKKKKMEYNKDEALKCLELARQKLRNEDFDGASRLVAKSKKLFPTPEAK